MNRRSLLKALELQPNNTRSLEQNPEYALYVKEHALA